MKLLSIYAAVLALFFVFLSVRTIVLRTRLKIGVGDGDNMQMRRAMRVHANFAEYVPLALLLMYGVELSGAANVWVHVTGMCLLVGRVLHAWGVSHVHEKLIYRQVGMVLTFASLIVSAGYLLWRLV